MLLGLVVLLGCGCLARPGWEYVDIPGMFEDYGCGYTTDYPRLGYGIQTTLPQCKQACLNGKNLTEGTSDGCNAIEWHNTTGWCNLYTQLCNSSVTPTQAPTILVNTRPWPWYRYYGDADTYYPVTCVLPHSFSGGVKCISSAGQCQSFTAPSNANERYKLTISSTASGYVFGYKDFPNFRFRKAPTNPCDVLGCALTTRSRPGYTAYRYVTVAPTTTPTTGAPTNTPTKTPTNTPAPTKSGDTLSPTTISPTPSPTSTPTLFPTTLGPTYAPTPSPTSSPTSGYCVLNLTGSLFKPTNCSSKVPRDSSCQLTCDSQSNRTDLFVNCSSSGEISWPSPCVLQGVLEGSLISLSFGLDFTLGCHVNTSDPTDVSLITSAFANNVAQQLEIMPDGSSVNLTSTTATDGFVDFLLVLRDRPPNATATDDANLILGLLVDKDQRDNLLLFSFTRNGTECLAQGNLVRLRIDFDSLFRLLLDLLANLPNYGVALLVLGLLALLICIPLVSRKSPHPFALLLLLTSMFSLANRAYFLSFVAELSTRAAHLEPSLEPLSAIYVATAVFLGLSVGLNVLLSLVLFVGLRNSSKFQRRWFELHPGSAVCGLLVSAFNPGNILILRSRLCNSESLNAPFPVEHLRRLEWIGLICALVSDLPPLVLTALTTRIVQGSSRFNWNQTKLNLLLPIVFSSVVIVIAVIRRCCKIRRYSAVRQECQESQSSFSYSVMDLAHLPFRE